MASLERLLALIDFQRSRDQLWFVGDLVNRGPRSLDVLRWARAHDDAIVCVLGNHDLHLLARAAGVAAEKKRDTLDDVLAAPDRDRLIDWLRHRPLVHHDDAHVLVHAGLHPAWTVPDARALAGELEHDLAGPSWRAVLGRLAGTPPRWDPRLGGGDRRRALLAFLVRVRTCRADDGGLRVEPDFDGPPALAPSGCTPWFALPDPAWQTHTAVFGHWAALGLDIHLPPTGPRHLGIDTGCVWGKSLTAVRLDDHMVFQVKAVEAAS